MKRYQLIPDYCFDSIYEVTPAFLKQIGVRGLACDIDNTLVTYDDAKPTPEVLAWLKDMTEAGICVAFVSNNHASRVNVFNEELGLFAAADAKKPSIGALLRFFEHAGVAPDEAAVVGDQIFTDVWMAKRAGAKALLVPPIKDRTDLFHRLKRLGEKPLLHRYYRRLKRRAAQSGQK